MSYDLSSDVMPEHQKGASFYGLLFNHCTSAPIWLSKCGKYVTLICPEDNNWNLAWGSTDGNQDEKSKRSARKRKQQ